MRPPCTRCRAIWLLLAMALAAGCAAQTARPEAARAVATASSADVSALIRQGCYACLERAFLQASAGNAPNQAFEAAALLALRSKELGVPPDAWLGHARRALPNPSWEPYLDMVMALPADVMSGDREAGVQSFVGPGGTDALVTAWRAALRQGEASDAFRAYLELSLVCGSPSPRQRDQMLPALVEALPAVPLLEYRLGACTTAYRDRLAALRAGDGEFVDADYALGRHALLDAEPDYDEALRRLHSAAAAFPASAAVAATIGNLHQQWEEWPLALAAHDAALSLYPGHIDALLGRTVSLSHLQQPRAAIESATRLIERGQWFLGQAFYWRAWNRLQLGELDGARDDADRARTLMVNAAVHVVSGLIEWRLGRRQTAEREFEQALAMDLGQCEAATYLGAVRSEGGARPEAVAAFRQAQQCYDLAITLRRRLIEDIQSGPGSEDVKSRRAAVHEHAIEDNERRRNEAAAAIRTLDASSRPPVPGSDPGPRP